MVAAKEPYVLRCQIENWYHWPTMYFDVLILQTDTFNESLTNKTVQFVC